MPVQQRPSVAATTLRPEIDDAARHVFPGRQPLRHPLMDRVYHADDPGVDARHLVNMDDRLDPDHMHDTLDALHMFGAIDVAIARDVLVHLLGLVGVGGWDW